MEKKTVTKRGKGRPTADENGVGRETLIDTAARLLQELPPAQVSIAAIGREAGVDPALIRYYFGNREALLFEVAQKFAQPAQDAASQDEAGEDWDAAAQLETFIHRTFRFTRSAKYMQRLMIEELGTTKSPAIQQKLKEWQRTPVAFYERLQARDGGEKLGEFDALFLHLAVVGISDFFQAGSAVVKMLASDGADIEELEQHFEAFVVRLLLDGLRRRND